ncbi:hypothetical protein Tco_0949242, partial [Tanacetum coccineum]
PVDEASRGLLASHAPFNPNRTLYQSLDLQYEPLDQECGQTDSQAVIP